MKRGYELFKPALVVKHEQHGVPQNTDKYNCFTLPV